MLSVILLMWLIVGEECTGASFAWRLPHLRFKRRRNPITNKGEHYCLSIYINQKNGMNDKEGQESPDLRPARESNANSRYAYSAFVGGHQTLAFVSHLYPTSR